MKKLMFLAALVSVGIAPSHLQALSNPKPSIKVADFYYEQEVVTNNNDFAAVRSQSGNQLFEVIASSNARVEGKFNMVDISSGITCSVSSMSVTIMTFGNPNLTIKNLPKVYEGDVSLLIVESGYCCTGGGFNRNIVVYGHFKYETAINGGTLKFSVPSISPCRPATEYTLTIHKQ